MAVSAPDSRAEIPGFCDPLGERVIVPQHSGALLEFLHFSDSLVAVPSFVQAMKDRVARLANFRHSSYCRVRRLQSVADRGGRPALVSAHVAGRRLAEVLEVAARAGLKPPTAGVLAVTRQMMASVALLHDFAPYGFHGAIGPGRLILGGEGRIVIAEHVLGTLVEEAAETWGVARLWQDFRIAALPDPKSAQYGRRIDVAQVGLVTLAMLLGRSLAASDYPHALPNLLGEAEETTPDGTHVPLRSPLRGWLERTLPLRADSSFRTLLEAQKAFSQLLQEGDHGASSAAWDAFVGACETAALRAPVIVMARETTPSVEVVSQLPAPAPLLPTAVELTPDESVDAVTATLAGQAGDGSVTDQASGFVAAPAPLPEPIETAASADGDPMARLREDPFGPWPVATPSGSAATLLDTFDAPPAPLTGAAALAAVASAPELPAADLWASAPAAVSSSATPDLKPETLFEAPQPRPVEIAPPSIPAPARRGWDEPKGPATTPGADWRTLDRGQYPSYGGLNDGQAQGDLDTAADAEFAEEHAFADRERRMRLAVLIGLALLAVAAAVLAPYAWKALFEGRLVLGTLSVDSNPAGAVISIDGQVRGHTPAEISVKAGEHLLEVQVGGSATSKKVTINANSKTVEKMTFPEAGERGGLVISTFPSKGKVTVDGISRGSAPVKVTDLQPGMHTLLVETTFGLQEQDVVVEPGRVSQLAVPTVSWLKVSAPYELTIYENGRLIGKTSSAPVMVAPGRRYLEFVNSAVGLRMRQFVDAVAGQVVVVPLELPTGMMNLYADQTAEVLVDGTVVGQTPLPSLQVPLGSHDVVFRHSKYGEVRYTVAVTLTAPVKLTVTFRK
jgi:hypothetical protein